MDNKQFEAYNFSDELFTKQENRDFHDKKLETKPVGYFKDAFRRFCKNKGSVIAAIIILLLVGFSIVGPLISNYTTDFNDINLKCLLPKSNLFQWCGWDGCERNNEVSAADYLEYRAIEQETGDKIIKNVYGSSEVTTFNGITKKYYDCYIDSYTKSVVKFVQLTTEQYQTLQKYQDDHDIQIIYPAVIETDNILTKDNACIYYQVNESGTFKNYPVGYTATSDVNNFTFTNNYIAYDGNDGYTSNIRIEENGEKLYNYAIKKQGGNWLVRVHYNRYFASKNNGKMPLFLFGSDQYGKDIFVRLSSGARFSFLFAIAISAINLIIGAIYGAIEGYYGGAVDMVMERVSDILSGVPFMVVVTLFKLHIMNKVGMIPTLLFAFVLTGWIGMASNTRMQFYRYKNQEYVLAARTLGARDARIMFKHIFPNSLGTLITSCVLVIPGVIFSESSLSYLGIINLSTGSTTSVGTLLANGQGQLQSFPHIILFPAVFIALLMISFNLFGNGLRDAFNPSLRGSE